MIGIANTLDLPERLMQRIASRLGGRRVVFVPYKRDQLKEIVLQRLADAGVASAFDERAITYAASKVCLCLAVLYTCMCLKPMECYTHVCLFPSQMAPMPNLAYRCWKEIFLQES